MSRESGSSLHSKRRKSINSYSDDIETEPDIELTEEQKEAIKNIKELDTGVYQKSELILVLLGEKPATDLEGFEEDSDEVARMLEKYGLKAVKKNTEELDSSRSTLSVARDESLAKELAKTSPEKDHKKYGELMGYPDSAIEAFEDDKGQKSGNELRLDREEYPEYLKELAFPSFVLSKENWDKEVKILQRWQNVLEQADSDLANKLKSSNDNK